VTQTNRVLSVESRPSSSDWDKLTLAPDKRQAFAPDISFREGWADMADVFGAEALDVVGGLALLSFKPEAVPGRRMAATLSFVLEHGLVPVAAAEVRHTRHSMRELWRYDWDIHPVDRMMLATTMHAATSAPLWLLRDAKPVDGVPAAVRLRDLRGAAAKDERRPHELRAVLDPPNQIINFVHVADEPADVVRELAIFLNRSQRRALLHDVAAGWPGDERVAAQAMIDRFEQAYEPHDLDFDRSLSRLLSAGIIDERDRDRLLEAAKGAPLLWDQLCSRIDPEDPRVSVWDFACVACEALPGLHDGTRNLVASAGIGEWRRHRRTAGTMQGPTVS
jgi:hypothetical protein